MEIEMFKIVNGVKVGFNGRYYIGRANAGKAGSILQNPFHIGKDGTREEVILMFKRYLWNCIKEKNAVYHELMRLAELEHDLEFACFCKPHACHGDVIIAAIEWLKNNE
jgi:hypothetical protein